MKIYRIAKLVYHNTRSEFLDQIKEEGLSAGTFSTRPIDFGGDVWLAVEESALGSTQNHQYGNVIALEPNWSNLVIQKENIFLVNKNGKMIGKLG